MFLTSFLAQEMHCCLFPRRKVKFEDNVTFLLAREVHKKGNISKVQEIVQVKRITA